MYDYFFCNFASKFRKPSNIQINMKKNLCYLLIVGSVVILSSCKSTESAYKQAYEKAVQEDVVQAEDTSVVPATNPQTVSEDAANVSVREEKVTVVSGDANIKAYGIVCGSFSLKANADALRQRLINDGYPAVVVLNEVGKTYRVICESFDTKEDAIYARAKFQVKYPDNQDFQAAWLLYKK